MVRASISGADQEAGTEKPSSNSGRLQLFDRLISKYKSWPLRLRLYFFTTATIPCTFLVGGEGGRDEEGTFGWKKGGEDEKGIGSLINAGNKSASDGVTTALNLIYNLLLCSSTLRVVARIYAFPFLPHFRGCVSRLSFEDFIGTSGVEYVGSVSGA